MSLINVIKCQFYVSLLIFTLLALGCASYKPAVSKSPLTPDFLAKNEVVVKSSECEIRIVMLKDYEVAVNYVGFDPRDKSLLPVFMRINNNSKDIVKVDFSRSSLSTDSGDSFQAICFEEAIDKVKIGDDESALWAIGFGLIGTLASGGNTANVQKTLADDYHNKAFKPTLINANYSGEGLAFFSVPGEKLDRIRTANIQLLHPLSHETTKITVSLGSMK